ncbi:MAG: phosphoribosylformylglycinamidine synthase subunit PurQ [Magnetospiraceae bacterium]
MQAAVIVFPGSNCDRDVKVALADCMGQDPLMVWHGDADFPDVDLIVLPGGFSYGDYLRCGAVSAHSPVMREVVRRANRGVHVLGICNGFQILCESGLLPGVLMQNAGIKFICRDVHLKVADAAPAFTRGYAAGQIVTIPVAHHDGNYQIDDAGLERLEGEGQVAFRYCRSMGAVDEGANINGSRNNIAGVFNPSRSVLGMMPHPERAISAELGGSDGTAMFTGLVEALS